MSNISHLRQADKAMNFIERVGYEDEGQLQLIQAQALVAIAEELHELNEREARASAINFVQQYDPKDLGLEEA